MYVRMSGILYGTRDKKQKHSRPEKQFQFVESAQLNF